MTPIQQRIAIARHLGWKSLPKDPEMIQYKSQRPDGSWSLIPDYVNDLNAMHEACKILDYDQAEQFESDLWHIACDFEQGQENPRTPSFACMNASAEQRAEAFLCTLNLWTA